MGRQQPEGTRPESEEIEQLKRLIEIQTQIVELAKQNELAERECEAVWQELSRDARRRARRSFLRPSGGRGSRAWTEHFSEPVRRVFQRTASGATALGAWLLPPRMGS